MPYYFNGQAINILIFENRNGVVTDGIFGTVFQWKRLNAI